MLKQGQISRKAGGALQCKVDGMSQKGIPLFLILDNGNRVRLLVSTTLDLTVVREGRKALRSVDAQDTPTFRKQMKPVKQR